MSQVQRHPSEPRKSADPRSEARAIARAASFDDPQTGPNLEGNGYSRDAHGSRKGVHLSLIVLSCVAACAFGFGLLVELVG